MAKAIDEPFDFTRAPSQGRRVSMRVGVPVVVVCGLMGYVLSIMAPIYPEAKVAPEPATAVLSVVEGPPPPAAAVSASAAPADTTQPAAPNPVRAVAAEQPTGPVIETGSVEQTRERPAVDKPEAVAPAPAVAPRAAGQVRQPVPRRPRVYYRRPVTKKYVGPFDALWPTYPK